MAAENPAPRNDSPTRKAFIMRIDQQEYDWLQEKVTGAQLRRLPPTAIPSDRDLFRLVPTHADRKVHDTIASDYASLCTRSR